MAVLCDSDGVEMSSLNGLNNLIADDQYEALRKTFLTTGKGRRPNLPPIDVDNRLLLQFHAIKEESGCSWEKISSWFLQICPDINKSRVRKLIERSFINYKKLKADERGLYLTQLVMYDEITCDLTHLGIRRSNVTSPPTEFVPRDISIKCVLDLHNYYSSNSIPFSSMWKWLVLFFPSSTVKVLEKHVTLVLREVRKYQKNKHRDPTFLYTPFTIPETETETPTCVNITTNTCSSCNRNEKLKEEIRCLKDKCNLLQESLKEVNKEKTCVIEKSNSLEKDLLVKDHQIVEIKQQISILRRSLRSSNKNIKERKKRHVNEVDVLTQKVKELSSTVVNFRRTLKRKNSEILSLNEELFMSNDIHVSEVKENRNNAYSNPVRKTVISLMCEAGVSAANVSNVIRIVSQHMFNHEFSELLPSGQCAINMMNEGYVLSNIQVAESVLNSSNVTLHSDGTSRDHKKIVGHQFTLDTGEVLFLGFEPVASEDAQTLLHLSIHCLNRLSSCYEQSEGVVDVFKKNVLPKITSLMTDRAACMKLYDKKFLEFVTSETGQDTNIHFLHCNAHFLLGLSSGCEKALSVAEEDCIQEVGEVLGRDKDKMFSSFQKEKSACTRAIRMTCEVLGARGDQKNGCHNLWLVFCNNSKIPNFKSNRFNCFFEAAAAMIFHHQKMVTFFTSGILPENINMKIKSVAMDVQDNNIMTFICCLALLYLKVTGPYWMLITKSSVLYTDFHIYVKTLQSHFEKWSDDPSELTDVNFKSVFNDFCLESEFYDSVHLFVQCNNDMSLMYKTLTLLCKECLLVTNRQLVDFLDDCLISNADEITRLQLKHCPLTNLMGESAFGDFDFDVGKRRNATLHNRSAVHCIKRNKTMQYVSNKSPSIQKKLHATARRLGPILKKEHRDQETVVIDKIRENFIANQQKKIDKQISEISKNATILESVKKHGGPCQTVSDLDALQKTFCNCKSKYSEILKSEIRYQKLVGHKLKFGPTEFMFNSLKSVLSANDTDTSSDSGVPCSKKQRLI